MHVSFATQSVTRLRANRVEEWGQEVVDWNVDNSRSRLC